MEIATLAKLAESNPCVAGLLTVTGFIGMVILVLFPFYIKEILNDKKDE